MRVEGCQHALDGVADQILFAHLLNIIFTHSLENITKQRQLAIGFLIRG